MVDIYILIYKSNRCKGTNELPGEQKQSLHCSDISVLHHSQLLYLPTVLLNHRIIELFKLESPSLSEAIVNYFPPSCKASGFACYVFSTALLYVMVLQHDSWCHLIANTFIIIAVVSFLIFLLLIYLALILILFQYDQLLMSGKFLRNTEIMMRRVIKVIQNEGIKSNPVSVFTFKSTYGLT